MSITLQRYSRSRRGLGVLIGAATLLLGLAAAGQAQAAYTCYWKTSACGFGGLGPAWSKESNVLITPTDGWLFHNKYSGTNKTGLRYVGNSQTPEWTFTSTSRIFTVHLPNNGNRRYKCYNGHNGNVAVNCGYLF